VSYDDQEGVEENGNNLQVQKLLLINARRGHDFKNMRARESLSELFYFSGEEGRFNRLSVSLRSPPTG
jgi:hypothetical protein